MLTGSGAEGTEKRTAIEEGVDLQKVADAVDLRQVTEPQDLDINVIRVYMFLSNCIQFAV